MPAIFCTTESAIVVVPSEVLSSLGEAEPEDVAGLVDPDDAVAVLLGVLMKILSSWPTRAVAPTKVGRTPDRILTHEFCPPPTRRCVRPLGRGQTSAVEPADDYLVRRAQEGYLDAFEVLLVRHRDRAYRIALRLLGDRAEAEDVAQDSMVQAWQSLPGFRGDATFSSWLYRIVVNKSRDAQRRRRPTLELDSPENADKLPRGLDPAGLVEGRAQAEALRAAIAALPFDQRAPLVLREFENRSYAEIASILGLSEAAARGRLARARQHLVEQLREWS